MAKFKIIFALAAVVSLASGEDNKTISSTVATIVAPITSSTPAPIVPTQLICKDCVCTGSVIDCQNSEIETFFSLADWLGVKPLNPSKVIMSSNDLTSITPLCELPIAELDLSHNTISTIQRASFKMLQSMRLLDLSYNNLTAATLNPHVFEGQYTPEEYQPLQSMRVLRLSYNQLHSLDQDVFEHLPELEELHLNGNPFEVIDHVTVVAISSLMSLKVLDMSDCQLKSLPELFLHTPRYLTRLDLSGNILTIVPPALEEGRSLTYLSLSRNPIRFIEVGSANYKPFPRMPSLTELQMCHMPKLEAIKAHSMSGLIALKKLVLDHNPALGTIDSTAFERHDEEGEGEDWPPITELYIGYNNLTNIDNGLIGRWDLLKAIDIRENPYLCDCSTQWMVSTLAPIIRSVSPNFTSDIICREPIEMRGKSLVHLEEKHSHMRCVDIYGDRPERDTALLIGTFIGVLVAVPMVLGILLLQRRGYFATCGLRGPAAFSRAFYKRTGTDEYIH